MLCDKANQITNAKTYVFTDSVLCLGGMKETNEAWKEKIDWYFESDRLKDVNRTDGESMEFDWKVFPGFVTFGLSRTDSRIHERTKV